MEKNKKTPGFPRILVLLFFVMTMIIIVIGLSYYKYQRDEIKEEKYDELSAISSLKLKQITDWRNERLSDVFVISENRVFIKALDTWFHNQNNKDLLNDIKNSLLNSSVYYHYENIMVIDSNAKVIISVNDSVEILNNISISNFNESVNSRKPVFSNIYLCNICGRIHLDIISPIYSGSKLISGIVFRINPETFLFPLLQTWPTPSKSSESLLITRDSNEIVYINELRHKKNTALKFRFKIDSTNFIMPSVKAAYGYTGLVEGLDYRGVPVLSDIRVIPDSPWWIISKIDLDEVYKPIFEKAVVIGIFMSLIFIFFCAGLFVLWFNHKKSLKLQDSQDKLERQALMKHIDYILKYGNDIIMLIDYETNIAEVNEKAISTYGYSREELIGKNIRMFRADEAMSNIDGLLKKIESENAIIYETIHKRKDGTRFPVEISVRLIEIEGNKYYQSVIRDITERKTAQDELRTSEEKFSKAFHLSPYALIITDPVTGRIIEVNKGFEKTTGYKTDEVIGKTTFDINIWDNPEDRTIIIHELQNGRSVYNKEINFRKSDGESANAIFSAELIDIKGNMIMLSSFNDITEIKKAELNIRNLVKRYHTILANQFYGILVVTEDNIIEFANDKFCEYFSLDESPSDLTGLLGDTLISKILPKYKDPQSAFLMIKNALANNAPNLDSEIELKNGTILLVDYNPIIVNGKRDGRIWLHRDITDRKKMEQDLRRNRYLLVETGKIAKVGGWEFDTQTLKGTWTDQVARIHDLDPNDETNVEKGISFYINDSRKKIEKAIKNAIEKGEGYDLELEMITAKGNHKWIRTIGIPQFKDGKVVNIGGSFQDITELKLVEEEIRKLNAELEERVKQRTEQLEESNKELEAFSYSVSHDLRAPLRALDGFAKILLDEYAPSLDDDGKRYLNIITDSAKSMGHLIDDLLAFSRLSRQEINSSKIDMRNMAELVFKELIIHQGERDIEFILRDIPYAYGDPSMIRQIWRNLIGNSIKFTSTKTKGIIEIGTLKENNEVFYYVKDNGVGFDMTYSEKLFGVFQRLHPSSEFEGTGVGLAIVQRIVHRHGGRVKALGKINEGAQFYFSLNVNNKLT
ncbi:MAG: PAS domain S-box protein [Ignavibacteria bacterium]|nr:PAS domain S-box protein [Ignavibacteria bacterium]